MKYSTIPSTITRSFWDGSVAIAENRKMEVLIYQKDNRREIKFPVGDRESRVAILSCHAPDGKETVISIYDKEAGKITLSINDPGGRKESIRRAIKDLMARTLTRKEENKGNDFYAAIENVLLDKIDNWLNDSRTDFSEKAFDEWHNDACKAVLEVLQKFYTNNDKQETLVQYGKAQKIVNMTMKGLYCLKDADQKKDYFKHCHIPLDSFTLEWFKRKVILTYSECYKNWVKTLQEAAYKTEQGAKWLQKREKKQRATFMREHFSNAALKTEQNALVKQLQEYLESPEVPARNCPDAIPEPYFTQMLEEELRKMEAGGYFPAELTPGRMLSWSAIPQQGSFWYGYDEYVRWIRVYFATNHTFMDTEKQQALTPFQAEFYIWSEIQLELAAEALYGQDIGKVEAVKDAKSEKGWPEQWKKDIELKSLDEQFKWCKDRFKEETLEKKIKYLSERIKKLNELFDNSPNESQEVLQ